MGEQPSRAKPSTFNDPDNYPAVTVQQPYAGLIALAGQGKIGKDIEIRSRKINYRGPLVIIAGQKVNSEADPRLRKQLIGGGVLRPDEYEAACGAGRTGMALAVMDIIDCRPMIASDRERAFVAPTFDLSQQWAWIANRVTSLRSFDAVGAQCFVRIRRDIVDAAQIHTSTLTSRNSLWRALHKRQGTNSQCSCGVPFPKHLIETMNEIPSLRHGCRCGKEYVVRRNKFVVIEAVVNKDVDRG